MRFLCSAIVLAASLFLVACGSFPRNPPLKNYDPNTGYRFDQLEARDNTDSLFVIVTFSGGGTRAAALSYGVMEALRDTTIEWRGRRISLLSEVDVISSISGGSFPAAYYALHGSVIFDEFPDKFLYRPIQSELVKQVFKPDNWPNLAGSSYGRSDLAAEFYNREVFDGGTYADIMERRRRPFVILNATDMTTGRQFPFIQDQFDLICSDLSSIPLARAAASSSAFPGVLTALTFENYAGSCNYSQPSWVDRAMRDHGSRINPGRTARAENRLSYTQEGEERRTYIHLMDGGVADNIGLRGPLTAISTTNNPWSVLRLMNNRKVDNLLVIVVNAATEPATIRDRKPTVPGLVDTVTASATVPLDNYSFDTINLLRATVNEFNKEEELIEGCKRLAAQAGDQCAIDIVAPHRVNLFPAQVAFEYINSDEDRKWFKNLPTTFELPRETIDKLREVGRKLLSEDPEFTKFLEAFDGCLPFADQQC